MKPRDIPIKCLCLCAFWVPNLFYPKAQTLNSQPINTEPRAGSRGLNMMPPMPQPEAGLRAKAVVGLGVQDFCRGYDVLEDVR